MTFQKQFEAALTVICASDETRPDPAYFAGAFYERTIPAADKLPTVLCGGALELKEAVTLSYAPLACRMLLYTEEGRGVLRISGKEYVLVPGSLLYLDRQASSFSLSAMECPWRVITFSLGGGYFIDYESLVPFDTFLLTQLNRYSPILRSLKLLLMGRRGGALANKFRDAERISAILSELFINAFQLRAEEETCAPYLRELKHYLDNNLCDRVQLSDLERRCHRNKFRICHEFSDAYGLPPLKYLNKKRVESAETLLLSTRKKVHEIALETGFENTNHFINLFKKEYGATPQAYREAHQN